LAVEPEDTFFNEGLTNEDIILPVCAGLVLVNENPKFVRLVHSTLQKHLEIFRGELFPNAELMISQTCLTYMSFDSFDERPFDGNETLNDRLREYPFLGYATRHYADHMRGGLEKTLKGEILGFLEAEAKVACAIQVHSFSMHHGESAWNAFPKGLNALHIAAFWGLTWIIGLLLTREFDISSYGLDGWTALH